MGTTTLLYRFIGLDAGAGAEFDKMAGKTAMLGKTSSTALTALKGLGIGAAAVGATVAVESVKMAAGFQTSMLRIETQANDSAKHVSLLSKGILSMAGAVATTPSVLADAAYHIASVGQGSLSTAQQLNVLKIAAEGAKIGGANLTDVTNALDGAIVSGIRGAQDYSKAMGVLNSTVGAGDMSMQDLADAIGTGVTVTAKQAGVNLRQLGAALAVYGDNNIRGARAGTMFRMAVQSLEEPASTAAAKLKELGLSSTKLSIDMQKGGLPKALADLKQHMIAAGDTGKKVGATLTDIFGKKAGQGVALLVGEYNRFGNKLNEVGKGASGFAASWATYNKSFAAGLDGAKAAGEALLITLGDKLLPVAAKLMNWIRTSAIPAIQGLASGFTGTGGEAGKLSPILSVVKAEFNGLAGIVRSVTATVRAHKAQLQELGRFISTVLVPVLEGSLKASFTTVRVALKVLITVVADGVTAFNKIRSAAHSVAAFFTGPFAGAFRSIGHTASAVFDKIASTAKTAVSKVTSVFRSLPGKIKGFFSDAKTWLIAAGKAIMSGLLHGITRGFDSVKSFVGSIAGKIKSLKGPLDYDAALLIPAGTLIMQGLLKGLKSQEAALEKQLTGVTSRIGALKSAAKDLASSLTDALSSPAGLSNLTIDKKGPTGQTGAFLAAYAMHLKTFVRDLTILRKNGLSPVVVDEIASLGATAGLPIVKDILGNFGAKGVKQRIGDINTSEKQVLTLSRGFGEKQSRSEYGKKVDKTNAEILLLRKELVEIKAAIKNVGNDTGSALNSTAKAAQHKGQSRAAK